ncbi:glycosyl transferase [Cladochytrium replicatum]|nr:glycosyl transferase [Cladochytrium replicatum]
MSEEPEGQFEPAVAASAVIAAVLIRACVGLHTHSGFNAPPLHGDFEAQRHWLEITLHLPISQWYKYDLEYWGLDYPPLTAYHSLLLGWIADWINPSWVALDDSRGLETHEVRAFMRFTALATELGIYVPAVWLIVHSWCKHRSNALPTSLLVILLQPALILIDHGHFQYNSAMLGFAHWAVVMFDRKQYAIGSIFFCLSLCFKQMALYYALPIFFYLLGVCLSEASRLGALRGVYTLAKIGVTTILTFSVILAPFALSSMDDLVQVFRRVFPIQRGLYEDKVANVWCSISVVIKLRQLLELNRLVLVSAVSTLLAVLPTSMYLLLHRKITTNTLLYALLNSSLAFFLLSFQVHEKSILLPLMPSILLMVSDSDSKLGHRWFQNVAVFSMFPLLKRDGLVVPYWITLGIWNAVVMQVDVDGKRQRNSNWIQKLEMISYTGMLLWHLGEGFITPPSRYPDLFVVLNVLWSAGHFALLFVHFNVRQFGLSSAIDKSRDGSKKKEQ